MNIQSAINKKIYSFETLKQQVAIWKNIGKKIVFTNGVFDLLHLGHLQTLSQSALKGDLLVVGINSDASVKRLKGDNRPIHDENTRQQILANLLITSAVIIFEEDTPLNLIKMILPNVIVKGGDYTINQIVGAAEVIENGGDVVIIDIVKNTSTSLTISKIKS